MVAALLGATLRASAEEFPFASFVMSTDDMPDGECQLLRFKDKKPVGVLTIPVTATLRQRQLRITRIANGAFWGCTELRMVRLPKPMRQLDDLAFVGCTAMTEFTFPEHLESIENNTFKGCKSLKKARVTGWTNLPHIVRGLPQGCAVVVIDPETKAETQVSFSVDGLAYIELPDGACLLAYDEQNRPNLTIPPTVINGDRELSVTQIGESAFYHREDLASVKFPASLSVVGSAAFSGCTSLKSVTLPAGLQRIEGFAFWGCEGLTQVALPAGLKSVGREAFSGCKALPRIALPEGLEMVGPEAFWDCLSLSSVTLPKSLKRIEHEAFYSCLNLQSITFPDGLEYIGDAAFEGCGGLKTLTFPSSLKELGRGAFRDCQNLAKVKLPDWAKLRAFAQGLPRRGPIVITDPKTKQERAINFTIEGVTYWELPGGECLVAACQYEVDNAVVSTTVGPNNLTVVSLAAEAFGGCDGLVTATLPPTLTEIGAHAFYRCRALASVQMPAKTRVATDAFEGCDRLDLLELLGPAETDTLAVLTRFGLAEQTQVELSFIKE